MVTLEKPHLIPLPLLLHKSIMAAVIVHGGSWCGEKISLIGKAKVEGCQKAAKEAHTALMAGRAALDAGMEW